MSGLIQRLLDRAGTMAPVTAAVVPTVLSASPLAAVDQRLQDPAFRDLGTPFSGLGSDDASVPMNAASVLDQPVASSEPHAPVMDAPIANQIARAPTPAVDPYEPASKDELATPMVDPIAALRAQTPDQMGPVLTPLQPQMPKPSQSSKSADPAMPEPPNQATNLADPVPSSAPFEPAPARPASLVSDPAVEQPSHEEPTQVRPAPPEPAIHETSPEQSDPTAAVPTQPMAEAAQKLAPVIAPSGSDVSLEPTVNPEPAPPQHTVERIVEKVLSGQPTPKRQPQQSSAQRHRPPSAESVSLIGALPQRRSTHTLFGLRRG